MCIVQTEGNVFSRILNWVRDRCPLWQTLREVDEVEAMKLGEHSSPERLAWIQQVVDESKVADGTASKAVIVYVTDQSDGWNSKEWVLPTPLRPVLFISEQYPEYEIRDVHVTHNSVHIYIRRVNTI